MSERPQISLASPHHPLRSKLTRAVGIEVSVLGSQGHPVAGYDYVVKSDHRDGTPVKSQWTVSVPEELSVFETCISNDWVTDSAGWGLHIPTQILEKLGESAASYGTRHDLFVAYFSVGSPSHGYPSDPVRSTREIPPTHILQAWLQGKHLRKATIRKMTKGMRCKP